MCPQECDMPRFLQLYIYDTNNEVQNRMAHFGSEEQSGLKKEIVEGLIEFLDNHNSLVQLFRTARNKRADVNIPEFKLRLYNVIRTHRYDLPTPETIEAIIFGGKTTMESKFDLIVEEHSHIPQRVNKLHPCYMALKFPLLFVYGEEGYQKDMKLVNVPVGSGVAAEDVCSRSSCRGDVADSGSGRRNSGCRDALKTASKLKLGRPVTLVMVASVVNRARCHGLFHLVPPLFCNDFQSFKGCGPGYGNIQLTMSENRNNFSEIRVPVIILASITLLNSCVTIIQVPLHKPPVKFKLRKSIIGAPTFSSSLCDDNDFLLQMLGSGSFKCLLELIKSVIAVGLPRFLL
uniref:Helitron helicase-like domain-containing protein n=1 Tax=Tanacetum cinerariifolium TaxID=118510 RepID=A0A699H6H8_TANCI|nr:helitron helicase-like domain-containing protein [Tanacetum cinerariifolium]